jgi:hypothetical protein
MVLKSRALPLGMHNMAKEGFVRTEVSLVVKQHIGWFAINAQPGLVAFVDYGLTSERTSPRDTAPTRALDVHASWSPDDPEYKDTQAHLRRSARIWIPAYLRPEPIAGQGVRIEFEQDRTGVRTSVAPDPQRRSIPQVKGSQGWYLSEEKYAYLLKNLFFDSIYPGGLETLLMPEVREIVEAAQQDHERWKGYVPIGDDDLYDL